MATASSQSTVPPVVPVGLFRRIVNVKADDSFVQQSRDECILPDDDICIINPRAPTTALQTPSTALTPDPTLVKHGPKRSNSQSISLQSIIASNPSNSLIGERYLTITPSTYMSKSLAPKIIVQLSANFSNNKSLNEVPGNREKLPQTPTFTTTTINKSSTTNTQATLINSNDTICLDSDDDDTINSPAKAINSSKNNTPIDTEVSAPISYAPQTSKTVENVQPQSTTSTYNNNLVEILGNETDFKQKGNTAVPSKRKYDSTNKQTACDVNKTPDLNKQATPSLTKTDIIKVIGQKQNHMPNVLRVTKNVTKTPGRSDYITVISNDRVKLLEKSGKPIYAILDQPIEEPKNKYMPTTFTQINLEEQESASTVTPQMSADPTSDNIENDSAHTAYSKPPTDKTKSKVGETLIVAHNTSIGSSDNTSSSSNPSSILNEVVHIRAVTPENSNMENNKSKTVKDSITIKPGSSKNNSPDSLKSILHAIRHKKSKSSLTKKLPQTLKAAKIFSNPSKKLDTNKTITVKSITSNIVKKIPVSKVADVDNSKQIVKTIDLTETLVWNNLNKDVTGANKSDWKCKRDSLIISGTPKDIMIKNNATKDKLLNTRTKSTSNTPTTMETIVIEDCDRQINCDVRKRPVFQSDTSAPKKRKTERPMTLEDFDIDDINDIIELE